MLVVYLKSWFHCSEDKRPILSPLYPDIYCNALFNFVIDNEIADIDDVNIC